MWYFSVGRGARGTRTLRGEDTNITILKDSVEKKNNAEKESTETDVEDDKSHAGLRETHSHTCNQTKIGDDRLIT